MYISFPNGLPSTVPPSTATPVDVQIITSGEDYVDDTATLHYRYNPSGSWETVPLTDLGGGMFTVDLPAAGCVDDPQYYFTAEGTESGVVARPSGAPADTYTFLVGEYVVALEDHFETDTGWQVVAGADTGNWERADPQLVTSSGNTTQPEDDHTQDGTLCYVTGAAAGNGAGDYDVDGGPSYLISPALDLSAGDATISYYQLVLHRHAVGR